MGEGESEPGDSFGQPWRLRQATLPLVEDAQCEEIYLEVREAAVIAGLANCCAVSGGRLHYPGDDAVRWR